MSPLNIELGISLPDPGPDALCLFEVEEGRSQACPCECGRALGPGAAAGGDSGLPPPTEDRAHVDPGGVHLHSGGTPV